MPGRDGTGPWGYGPLTGGRRGHCAGGAGHPAGGGGRGWRNQFHATGLSGWQRAAQADARATEQIGDSPGPFAGSRASSPRWSSVSIVSKLRSASSVRRRTARRRGRAAMGWRPRRRRPRLRRAPALGSRHCPRRYRALRAGLEARRDARRRSARAARGRRLRRESGPRRTMHRLWRVRVGLHPRRHLGRRHGDDRRVAVHGLRRLRGGVPVRRSQPAAAVTPR